MVQRAIANYLDSGKPVLAPSTGVERCFLTRLGFLTFSTFNQAATDIWEINRNYEAHCRAARALAEE